jgi:hypothetical protein
VHFFSCWALAMGLALEHINQGMLQSLAPSRRSSSPVESQAMLLMVDIESAPESDRGYSETIQESKVQDNDTVEPELQLHSQLVNDEDDKDRD